MFIDNFISPLFQSLHSFYNQPLLDLLVLVFLLLAVYQDVKMYKISDKLNLAFLICSVLLILIVYEVHLENFFGMVFAFLILLIPAMIKMKEMGGDIKLIGVLGFDLGIYLSFPFIFLSCFYGIAFFMIKKILWKEEKKKEIPFSVAFLCSYITLFVISLG